jgi:hypothetical protein
MTWTEGLVGDATVTTQPMSITTSKPSNSTKKSRVSAGRSDFMFGTALLIVTLRVISGIRPITQRPSCDDNAIQPQFAPNGGSPPNL